MAQRYHQRTLASKPSNPTPKQIKSQIKKYLIKLYINQQLLTGGMALGLDEASRYLNIPSSELLKKVGQHLSKSGLAGIQDLSRAAILKSLFGALSDRSQMTEWASNLISEAEGRGYPPLLVKEANSALGNQLTSAKAITDIAKALGALGLPGRVGPTTHIQVNQAQSQEVVGPTHQYLTTDAAIKLIEDRQGALPLASEELHLKHNLDEVPNIDGLAGDGTFGAQSPEASDRTSKLTHEDRRARQIEAID